MGNVRIGFVRALALCLAAAPVGADIQLGKVSFSGDNRLGFYDNEVTGPGAGSSFLTRHGNFDDQLSLNADWAERDGSRWSSQFQGRATNDPRSDVRNLSMQRFSLDRFNAGRHVGAGDFYASFTQYTLNQSLKGLRWEEENLGGLQLSLVGGIAKNRWDDLWTRNVSESVDRYVAGMRARRSLPLGSELGFSAVVTRDHRTAGSGADQVGQNLVGVSWALPSDADLAISGESAFSRASVDHQGASGEVDWGSAHKVSARSRFLRWRTWDDFENVAPNFNTTMGAATQDFRRVQTRQELRLNDSLVLLGNYSWYRNNLAGQLSDTARTSSPEGGVRWVAPFNRASLNLEGKLRYRETKHSSASVAAFRSVSEVFSASDRIGSLGADLQYERRNEERAGSAKDVRNIVGGGLAGFWRWRESVLRPYVRYNIDLDKDQIANGTNQVTEGVAGLAADITPAIYASFNYTLNRIYNFNTDGMKRDNVNALLGYNVPWLKGDRVEVGYRNNFYGFATASKNYREKIVETSYVHKL